MCRQLNYCKNKLSIPVFKCIIYYLLILRKALYWDLNILLRIFCRYIVFIVLFCCPMHCDLFKIYCAPLNLGITRTWMCRLNFAQRPIFSGYFLTSLKSQTQDPQLKFPPGGLVLRVSRPEKIHRPQPGLNPRTIDLEATTLPRDHRGHHH